MRLIRERSIRTKLILLSAVSVGVALTLSCAGLTWNEVRTLRASKTAELATQAEMLAFNSTGVLSFRDVRAAEQLLASLQSQPAVEFACLYDADGRVLATYPKDSGRDGVPPAPGDDDCRFNQAGQIELFQRIVDGGESVGALYLRANTDDLRHGLIEFGKIAIAVILCSIAASALPAFRIQRAISEPILRLARTATKVTSAGDYSIRVEYDSRDELGVLCAEFNRMLERVETTDSALKQAHEELEERVVARTTQLRQEIERRERIQAELVRAKDAAEAANRSKSDFLANMSHEIRTPMTAILGFTDVLLGNLGDSAQPENVEVAEIIKQNAEHLLNILSDILDLSKVEAGKLEVERVPTSPFQALSETVSLMRVRADAKGLSLSVEFVGPIPETILTDPIRLRQILANLVGNAVKFTEVGGIRVVARMVEAAGGAAMLRIDVVDTGIGIAAAGVAQLFRPFTQADTSTSRKFGGTGLGLAISKRLAEMLGGSISVTSEPDRGSTFTLTIDPGPLDNIRMLDAVSEAIQALPPAVKSPLQPTVRLDCRILLAEDGPDNRRLISFLLKKAGAEVVTVENGQLALEDALASCSDSADGQNYSPGRFDVILMDMQMPVLDGYEATRRLRAQGYRGPILALTAHAMTEDRQKCLDAGCDDYLTKPIERARLLEVVQRYNRHGVPA